MRIRIVITAALGLLLFLGPAVAAKAACPFVFSPTHGQPGSIVTVSSYYNAISSVTMRFDGTLVADYDLLPEGEYFSFDFVVPPTATPGNHKIWANYGGHEHGYCYDDFTVDAADTQPVDTVPEDAYPVKTGAVAVLPSTGITLLLPAAGILGGCLGILLVHKRQ